MAALVRQLSPDEVRINTPLRPCPVTLLTADEIAAMQEEFRTVPDVATVYNVVRPKVPPDVAGTRRRRPEM
jgi:hypothetical protein